MSDRILEIDSVAKEYRMGMYGSGTLHRDLQSWYARIRGKADPHRKLGAVERTRGEDFMALEAVSMKVRSMRVKRITPMASTAMVTPPEIQR